MISDAEMVGQRFGKLVVQARAERIRNRAAWSVLCDCGSVRVVTGNALRTGNTKSCGCVMKTVTSLRTHGMSRTRAYGIWKAAKQRCFDPKAQNYRFYGGRGITMDPDWAADFEHFHADMGECPPGFSLERDDFDGNYEPGNCRWATKEEQARNTSRNTFVDMGGVSMVLKDYAELRGVGYNGIRYRMRQLGEDAHTAATRLLEGRLLRQSKARAAAA